jgi:CRP-like cAMP-binding protein
MSSDDCKNQVLRAMPQNVRRQVLAVAEPIHHDSREALIRAGSPITHVWFPESGIISIIIPMDDDSFVELNSVGRDGMVGVPVVFGVEKVVQAAFCQVAGMSWRIAIDDFKELTKTLPEFELMARRYAMMQFEQVAINTGCNRTHTTEQRCAKWLLLNYDRSGSPELTLTQEFLAGILGVSRTSVNATASKLAEDGLIHYVRGKIKILDKPALEALVCPCYQRLNAVAESVLNATSRHRHNNH